MPNSKSVFDDLAGKIHLDETKEEIHSILYLLLEHVSGLSRTDILSQKEIKPLDDALISEVISRINLHEPIQYILGEADFYGRKFSVDPSVLIPRPETEQLIIEVLRMYQNTSETIGSILEIGTGSGCIAITLAKEFPGVTVTATDVSPGALMTASANAKKNQAEGINFVLHSVLTDTPPVAQTGLLISNPPYITHGEKHEMRQNVLHYEPELALFAPENDPLLFYRAIASLARKILSPAGKIMVEINERFGPDVATLFIRSGFTNSVIQKDINDKDRFVIASRD